MKENRKKMTRRLHMSKNNSTFAVEILTMARSCLRQSVANYACRNSVFNGFRREFTAAAAKFSLFLNFFE